MLRQGQVVRYVNQDGCNIVVAASVVCQVNKTLAGVVGVWQAVHGPRRFGRAGLHLIGIGLGGAALFGLSWVLIGRWLSKCHGS